MRDGEHPEVVLIGGLLDAAGHRHQCVYVEARVDLIEHRIAGAEHAELERLVALLLAAREVDVEGPVEEALVDAQAPGLGNQGIAHGVRVAAAGTSGLDQ